MKEANLWHNSSIPPRGKKSVDSHAVVEPYRVYMESLAEKEREQLAMAEAGDEAS